MSGGAWDSLFPACGGTPPAELAVPAAAAAAIALAARAGYPSEACGLLVGTPGRVERMVPAANVAERARDRFEIDPRVRLSVMKELRGTPQRVIGHWHSHPDHPPRPSTTDLAQAYEPALVWVICAVDGQGVTALEAWRVVGGEPDRHFEPVVIRSV